MSKVEALYYIREKSTGNVRLVDYDIEWATDPDGNAEWFWSEGNNGCDCNRHLLFTDYNEDAPSIVCNPTREDSRYEVRVIASDDGRILYDEWGEA